VLEADRTCDFPLAVVVMPNRDEFGISNIVWFVWMMKSMNSNFDSPVALQRVDLKCVLDEFPPPPSA
jgi:hypothetical protein